MKTSALVMASKILRIERNYENLEFIYKIDNMDTLLLRVGSNCLSEGEASPHVKVFSKKMKGWVEQLLTSITTSLFDRMVL